MRYYAYLFATFFKFKRQETTLSKYVESSVPKPSSINIVFSSIPPAMLENLEQSPKDSANDAAKVSPPDNVLT